MGQRGVENWYRDLETWEGLTRLEENETDEDGKDGQASSTSS